ncbi:twin-arginine translocase TatA/TatE family subunit [bacterium]|nr:MAG: twin-arginine translocase TatA/TatE family subunit [bacterium]
MPHFGLVEILIVAAIVIVLFGGRKIPELMKGVGLSFTEYKKGLAESKQSPPDRKEE